MQIAPPDQPNKGPGADADSLLRFIKVCDFASKTGAPSTIPGREVAQKLFLNTSLRYQKKTYNEKFLQQQL
jgi:hypothetical protein